MKNEEKHIIEDLRKRLIGLHCPLVEADEDAEQVKSLLLDDSEHRENLLGWLLERLTEDDVVLSMEIAKCGDAATILASSFDLHFNNRHLDTWKVALRLLKAKKSFATNNTDETFSCVRTYMDYLTEGEFARPIDFSANAGGKSTLIPRDLEKDVSSRVAGKKAEAANLLLLQDEAILPSKENLVDKINTKREILDLQSGELTKDHVPSQYMVEQVASCQKATDQFTKDFELDLKPWCDRVKPVKTDMVLENQGKKLQESLIVVQKQVGSNDQIRKHVASVNDIVRSLDKSSAS